MVENYQDENFKAEDEASNKTNQANKSVRPANLGEKQKIAASILIVFAFFTIWMWGSQFKKSVYQPFERPIKSSQDDKQATVDEEDLRLKDTDGDNLTDWDELNIFKTSPYLEDTDSDGVSDLNEIVKGQDPNCPESKNCYNTTDLFNAESSVKEEGVPELPDLRAGEGDIKSVLGGQMNAETLRQLLIDSGMDMELINQVSDSELMGEWEKSLEGDALK